MTCLWLLVVARVSHAQPVVMEYVQLLRGAWSHSRMEGGILYHYTL
jgi:hypothetical protein